MLLERTQWIVGAVFAAVLLAGTVLAITFDRSWITGGATVEAHFHDAAGLAAGDNVLIAGVRSGSVEGVRIEDGHAVATLRVESPLPNDSTARIILQNFLGKRAVMLDAGDDWDRLFESGDQIPLEATSTPVDYAEFNQESVGLLRGTDTEALRALVTSVADITEGQREEVGRLLDGLQRLTQVVADRKEDLSTVIDRSEVVFGALAEKDEQLVTIIDEFGSTLSVLADRRNDITRLLGETARASRTAADLVSEEREVLDRSLDELHTDLEIVDAHQVDLAHVFAYGGVAFEGYANIGQSGDQDNPYWGNIFAQSQGEIGVDPIAGCGGAVDQLLDELFGPDPRTCEEQEGQEPGDGDEGAAASTSTSFGSWFARGLLQGAPR